MITLDQAKAHLNVTTTFDDDLITDKLAAAKGWVTDYTGASVDLDTTPAPVREAVLQLTAQLYDNREITASGITAQSLPFGFLDLLVNYRAYSF
ncbi:head-tail connector protein [Bradyrhizobium sp. NP1]|uniref:head-tail connector protein n=1 Tax=Bradyrhizobium sp. NP1 TaxID=3049772 RepID=UPI0025A583AF|nr:head-tail connector protein [Bradyrhizobium sp. NP1]WJR76010.1 head-tail connector protein [Bradyrhizobium sp. NP1]